MGEGKERINVTIMIRIDSLCRWYDGTDNNGNSCKNQRDNHSGGKKSLRSI